MNYKFGWIIGLIFWTIIIFILCTLPIPEVETKALIPHLDKLAHFGLFFIFSTLLLGFLRITLKCPKIISIFLVLMIAGFYGGIIEWLQGDFFHRSADIVDWVADMLGALVGIIIFPFAHRLILKK